MTEFLLSLCLIFVLGILFWAWFAPKHYSHLSSWEFAFVALLGIFPASTALMLAGLQNFRPGTMEFFGQFAILAYVVAYFPLFFWWHKQLPAREERAKREAKDREYERQQELERFRRPPPEEFMRHLKAAIAPIATTPEIRDAFLKGAPRFYENSLIPRDSFEKQQTFAEDTAVLLAERFATFVREYKPLPKPSGPSFVARSEHHPYDEDIARQIGMMGKIGAMRDEYAHFHAETFKELFDLTATKPFVVSDKSRFEHTLILGPQGSFKTQLMQYLITEDIKRDCAIMVIDSQGDLVKNVSSLEAIQDRLVLVEPGAVAINPFDFKGDRAVDLLTYVFTAFSAEFTPRQAALYRYSIRLLQAAPYATIVDFMELLRPDGIRPYYEHVASLSPPAQAFFADEFNSSAFKEVKEQVGWRLKLMLENDNFYRMFSAKRTKLDLGRELDARKIVVVDTNKDMLGDTQSALLGRFFIAMLLMAAQGRREKEERVPTFVYIDEAHEYLQDDTVTTLLDQARKMRVGMHLATQRLSNVKNTNMRDALLTTSVKFAHTDNENDTRLLAGPMKTTPEELAALPDRVFQLSVRGGFSTPVEIPFLVMENMEHVSRGPLQKRMREMYGPDTEPPRESPPPPPPPAKSRRKKPEPVEDEDDEIKPSPL